MPEVVQAKRAHSANPVVDPLDARFETALRKLKPEQAEPIRRLLHGDSGTEPELQGDIDRFRQSAGLRGASDAALEKIFAAMAANPADPITLVIRPLREKNLAKLSSEDQCAVLDIALKDSRCSEAMSKLLSRETANGEPVLTNERDNDGRTLLANLTKLVRANALPEMVATASQKQALELVPNDGMFEVTAPRRQPAEYVRLVTGLLVEKSVDAHSGKPMNPDLSCKDDRRGHSQNKVS